MSSDFNRTKNEARLNEEIIRLTAKRQLESFNQTKLKNNNKRSKYNEESFNYDNELGQEDIIEDNINDPIQTIENNYGEEVVTEVHNQIIEEEESNLDEQEENCNQDYNNEVDYWIDDEVYENEFEDDVENDGETINDAEFEIAQNEIIRNWDEIEQASWEDHSKYDSFEIKHDIVKYLSKHYSYLEPKDGLHEIMMNVFDDDEELLDNKNTKIFLGSIHSKYDFESKLCCLASSNTFSDKTRKEILAFIKDVLPVGAYVPDIIGKPTESNIMPASSSKQQSNVFIYDICLCGYTVYEGDNFALEYCPTCKTRRYTGIEDTRYPIATINYHPIIFIICELLENKTFVTALNTCNEDAGKTGLYCDISDGAEFKKNMTEMNYKYNIYKNSKQIPVDATRINILLSIQYDGAQVFHYTVSNFWPMLISILNLPPNIRKTLGHGMFLISLFTALSHSSCENFIMSKCLVDELKMLYEGILVKVNGQIYFVQARLVLHCYDSKALEAICCFHGANSITGCGLCRLSPG